MRRAACSWAVLLALIAAVGCAPVTVGQTTIASAVSDLTANVVITGELSPQTVQFLRAKNLERTVDDDAVAVLRALAPTGPAEEEPDRLLASSEVALLLARRAAEAQAEGMEAGDPADWSLLAAARAWDYLFADPRRRAEGGLNFLYHRAWLLYGAATAGFVKRVAAAGTGSIQDHERTVLGETLRVHIAAGPEIEDPTRYDELILAGEVTIEGLQNRHRTYGFGVGLVGHRENRGQSPEERYYPRIGTFRPLTALLSFERPGPAGAGGGRRATLAFYSPIERQAVEIEGQEVPLAGDFTAPLGYQIARSSLSGTALRETFSSEKFLDRAGFYLTEPYDPRKIPLITVHGLLSSPLTWVDLHNNLLADPLIRRHYQIWHFMYPPGLPVLYSAALFRDKLDELYRFFDPEGKNPNMNHMVVVAHSMGGLITHTAVSSSGQSFWLMIFGRPPEEVELPQETKADLARILAFERKPFITRVIFVSTPHRGSSLSESFTGRIGRWLTTPPRFLVARLIAPLRAIASILTPEARSMMSEDPVSIRSLSPNNPTLRVLSEILIERGVPFHSIMGDRGRGDGVAGSDGVVPYTSAHLDGAESELVVPSDHGAHRHPLAVAEIKRILKLHLTEAR